MSTMLVKCEKCGGDLVVGTLRAQGVEILVLGTMSVGKSPVEAHVCVECGYTALFAANPSALRLRAHLATEQAQPAMRAESDWQGSVETRSGGAAGDRTAEGGPEG